LADHSRCERKKWVATIGYRRVAVPMNSLPERGERMSLTRSVMKWREFATSLAFHSGGPSARTARAEPSRDARAKHKRRKC
jgi:hypothetical protein